MDDATRRYAAVSARTAAMFGVDVVPIRKREGGNGGRGSARSTSPDREPPIVTTVTPVAKQAAAPREPATLAPATGGRDREVSQRMLDTLRERYEADAPHQHFVTDHHSIVFGEGDPCARLVFIGEAPGADEDRTGRPFVGKAGQLLEKMIVAMGLSREQVYICNVLKTRPPGNATPTSREAELCRPYLIDQVRIIKPEVIVTLGLPASRTILRSEESMGRLRGKFTPTRFDGAEGVLRGSAEDALGQDHASVEVAVMPTYHPAYLLRDYTPENRAKVWSDLQQVMVRLGLAAGEKTG
jgi:DNA polymerase